MANLFWSHPMTTHNVSIYFNFFVFVGGTLSTMDWHSMFLELALDISNIMMIKIK